MYYVDSGGTEQKADLNLLVSSEIRLIDVLEIGINKLSCKIEEGVSFGRRLGKFRCQVHEGEPNSSLKVKKTLVSILTP